MKSLVLTSEPLSQDTSDSMSSGPSDEQTMIVKHRRMQQGLLARAAQYTSNASKATSTISQFNGILLGKRDPIVWGDASNRYNYRRSEINNNEPHEACQGNPNVTADDIDAHENVHSSELYNHEEEKPSQSTMPKYEVETSSLQESSISQMKFAIHESSPRDTGRPNYDVGGRDESLPIPAPQAQPEVLSFNTTQQLRSGFFRSIKRQYSPLLPAKVVAKPSSLNGGSNSDSDSHSGQSASEHSNENEGEDASNLGYNNMSKLAKQKLEQLRKRGPQNVDVPTGLQWIRLELHEMREQDKSLFLQLIKLHSTIKDLRADFSGSGEFDSYDDLHSAASLWWPRRGCNLNTLPDFSSSDGAQLLRGGKSKPPLRRGFSLNYPPIASPPRRSPDTSFHDESLPSSTNGSQISIHVNTATAI